MPHRAVAVQPSAVSPRACDFHTRDRMRRPRRCAALRGASDRLRPVLMTALVTSTLLTLLVLPTLYRWIEGRR